MRQAESAQPVFVVEDDLDICGLIEHSLRLSGYSVRSFLTGLSVLTAASAARPCLFLLDIMLPGTDGFDLCWQIRQTQHLAKIPIIFLTAKASEADRIKGLEMGADDYITKPFSPRELVARVRAVLRRPQEAPLETLTFGELVIDPFSMTVTFQGRAVTTTAREFRLLEYLASHRSRVFTRGQLLDAVWKETAFVTARSVDVYMCRLRDKIEPDPSNPQYLKTIRGVGYRFEVPR